MNINCLTSLLKSKNFNNEEITNILKEVSKVKEITEYKYFG